MSIPVLICDDSNLARKQMARTLPPFWDVDVTFAKDGSEGIDVIKAGKGNIVFLDLNMPVMDGITLIRELRSLPNYKFTPLLMLTTESGLDKKSEGKAAGATGRCRPAPTDSRKFSE